MITKRLYVGGLSHNISEKDLKDRFGKFGEVSDVEVVTRKDEDGNPVKTFGYININLSDAEFKRCMTVLNKSKWKGGTLQIEIAKESFLHRLAVERQQAAENAQAGNLIQPERLVDSLKKVGVENFHMKAAVPGTEIPEHKDWIVSKFGRVLPILNLKCEGKSKIFKYDPSKHCHNIKKLDTVTDVSEFTSISQLTWEIPGGDDEISKKRRGEFPPQKPRPKKIKQDLSEGQTNSTIDRLDINNSVCERLSYRGKQKIMPLQSQLTLHSSNEMVVTREASERENRTDDGLEVVGDDFIVKSIVSQCGKSKSPTSSGNVDDQDYDSADTDEILTRSKAVDSLDTELNTYSKPSLLSEDGEESDDNLESDSSIESDYESMMTNCCRLEISLGDLEMLAKRSSENSEEEDADVHKSSSKPVSVQSPKKVCVNPEDILTSILGTHSSEDEASMKEPKRKHSKKKMSSSLPAFMGTKGLFGVSCDAEQQLNPCTTMHNSVEEQKTNTVSKPKHCSSEVQAKIPHVEPSQCISPSINVSSTLTDDLSSEPSKSSEEEDIEEDVGKAQSTLHCSASSEDLKDERNVAVDLSSVNHDQGSIAPRKTPVPLHNCDAEKQRQDNERRLAALEQRQKESAQQKKLIQGALAEVDTPNAHRGKHIVFDSDNDGDVEEASSSGEESEDAGRKNQNQQPNTSGACRLFDSSEEEEDASDEDRFQIKPQFEGKAGQRLMELQSRFGADERFQMNSRFMESEEEEVEEDEEQLKKLGNVSHVVEEKLVEEKKKNLEILQSVLNITKQPGVAECTKSKIFRDVSSLHYDPTREDHAAFEKSKVLKTEGKATRRKKLAEAEKLPEVSKDIFYDVAVDLKEVFGSTLTTVKGERDVSWDKKEEAVEENNEQSQTPEGDTDMQSGLLSLATPEKVQSTGFKFSFFGADTDPVTDANAERGEYRIEPLTRPKVSWQVDPRFQDSSSDDEDTEENEGETNTVSVAAVEVEGVKPSKKKLFFFYQDDDRLKEGPILFCRPTKLQDQREEWEEKRSSLIEEYRKKHRAARKKMRESHHN